MSANLFGDYPSARSTEMSPLPGAMVGYVTGESFAEPTIAELTVSAQQTYVYIGQGGSRDLMAFRASWMSARRKTTFWVQRNQSPSDIQFEEMSPVENCAGSFEVFFDAGAKRILLSMAGVSDILTFYKKLFFKMPAGFNPHAAGTVIKASGEEGRNSPMLR